MKPVVNRNSENVLLLRPSYQPLQHPNTPGPALPPCHARKSRLYYPKFRTSNNAPENFSRSHLRCKRLRGPSSKPLNGAGKAGTIGKPPACTSDGFNNQSTINPHPLRLNDIGHHYEVSSTRSSGATESNHASVATCRSITWTGWLSMGTKTVGRSLMKDTRTINAFAGRPSYYIMVPHADKLIPLHIVSGLKGRGWGQR